MAQALLVYDGSNPLFRAVVETAARRSDEVVAVRWESEPVQSFLEAQFGARPFAFILVEGDSVHVGAETVERVFSRLGLADPVVDVLKRSYAVGGAPLGRLLHGRTVADVDGTFPLSAEASSHLADLCQGPDNSGRDPATGEQ